MVTKENLMAFIDTNYNEIVWGGCADSDNLCGFTEKEFRMVERGLGRLLALNKTINKSAMENLRKKE